MICFPNAKINIGLAITGKRLDGFHNIETVFYPVAIKDALEIIEGNKNKNDAIFSATGNAINVNAADNLCVKAYHLLKKDFPLLPAVKIHLHKHIPMGAGMGGGSADASAVLMLLNQKFNLNIPTIKLQEYALLLGSDCPFFIINKPCFAAGRGEILNEIKFDLSAYKIMIVYPGIHINTKETFALLDSKNFSPEGALANHILLDIANWKALIKNDFEAPVFKKHSEIKEIKEKLYNNGAIYSAMSGSGSSVFGIFLKTIDTVNIKFPSHYFCQTI